MEDPPLIIYDDVDVQEGLDMCSKSLTGAFLTSKPIHVNSLSNALAGIWCNPKGSKVEEIGEKKFQFLFDDHKDTDRILKRSPWIFRNAWLSLKRTTKMGLRIGACMGDVLESEIFETWEKGSFIKVLVLFYVTKPLKPGINVGSKVDGMVWVDFVYERLPQFCYSCGLIGHDEDGCKSRKEEGDGVEADGAKLGPWMRAAQIGRKVPFSNSGNDSHTKHSTHRTRSSTLPKDFLNMLSALSVTKETTAPNRVDNKDSETAHLEDRGPLGVHQNQSTTNSEVGPTVNDENTPTTDEPQDNDRGKKVPQVDSASATASPLRCVSNTVTSTTKRWKR
ncbi:Zinc knuckle CX2CX4HX4C [Sesbania bispinosa]|nr:Zinc knuckle CX2CX4HX4C [Sesbania bispinosa]